MLDELKNLLSDKTAFSENAFHDLLDVCLSDKRNAHALVAVIAGLSARPFDSLIASAFVRYLERNHPKRALATNCEPINIVGTGGGRKTFNISTTAAFVAASCGTPILKSGSHSYDSQCGSLDVLSAQGINVSLKEPELVVMLDELGIGFVSPAMYPPLLRRIATSIYPLTLKQIGSFINTIGPFLCPFKLAGQLCGVRSQALMLPFSEVAQQLDIKNVALVWSDADMDEFCSVGCNHIYWPAQDGHQHTLTGRSLGMQQLPLTDLAGGTPETNASLMKNLLNNTAPEIAIDTVILNAAYLLRLHNLSLTTVDAIGIAKEAINSGQASRLLTRAIECSHDLSNIH